MNGVLISQPIKKSELRLTGIDESVTTSEVKLAIAALGCHEQDIRCGDFRMRNGLYSLWIQCLLGIANKILKDNGIHIG